MFPAHLFENLPVRFLKAAKLGLLKILEQPEVLGVLLAGSVAQGLADEHSDLDFYVVTHGKQRWRGCWQLEQTPVEYFFNPAEYLQRTIQTDASALQILATGIVIIPHPELGKLQHLARDILAAPRPINHDELEFDRFNTVECVLETRSAFGTEAYRYILPQAVVYILKAIYRKHGWWEVRAKSVLSDLRQRAPELEKLATQALGDLPAMHKQAALETLAKAVVEPIGLREYHSQKQSVLE
jgi:predicted nucleotidyltransferase